MEAIHIKSSKNSNNFNYTYLYRQLKETFVNDFRPHETIREDRPVFTCRSNQEYISFEDVLNYVKNDLEPFFKSIFNINIFNRYVNLNNVDETNICSTFRKEYIDFIYKEANTLAKNLNDFKNGHNEFYGLFTNLEKDLTRNLFLFVFRNSHFTGKNTCYFLNGDSNQFIKEYLNSILIQTREKPKNTSSRLLQLEVNRIQVLILKNTRFNFLNWYLTELKCALNDLKFIHDCELTYGLKCSEIKIRKLYRKLKRADFIDIDHTTEINFIEVFLKEWYTHDSICVLKMDNPQTKYFLDQFKVHIDTSLKVSDIAKVKNIANKNGYISSSSLSASSSRNKLIGPKREQDLLLLFK